MHIVWSECIRAYVGLTQSYCVILCTFSISAALSVSATCCTFDQIVLTPTPNHRVESKPKAPVSKS